LPLSIYQLKPAFQKLLSAPVQFLKRQHVSPNQVTLAALALSLIYGALLWRFPEQKLLWAALPVVLLLRMALNAIDGLLALAAAKQTKLGALLNEISDQLADAALYLPFAYAAGLWPELVVVTVLLAAMTEFTGVVALTIGSPRGFAGPMGKSDRAFAFAVLAIAVAAGASALLSNSMLGVIVCLLIWTIRNRVKLALAHSPTAPQIP
jgi:CDP-diacylglycerol--glycerol-3-phosphate 3-phosphatidyltransferase